MTARKAARSRLPGAMRGRAAAPAYGSERELENWLRSTLAQYDRLVPGALLAYHTLRSDGSAAGFPDWVISGRGGLIFRELKSGSGKLSPAQQQWAAMLGQLGASFAVWRPADRVSGLISAELRAVAGLGIAERDRRARPTERG